ncbi:nucleoside/nucleotide kinase family protein, partial [Schumannella luteola]
MNAAGFADELRARAAAGARVIAGLAGEPGAGKSTVAARLAAEL